MGLDKLSSQVKLPHKKPKDGALSQQQKDDNRAHSRVHITVEHKFVSSKGFVSYLISTVTSESNTT